MTALVVVLWCVWGAAAQPRQNVEDQARLGREATLQEATLREVAASQRDMVKMIQDAATVLTELRTDFTQFRTDDNAQKVSLRMIARQAERREELITNLTATLQEKTSGLEERERRIHQLEHENLELNGLVEQQHGQLQDARDGLDTLRRHTQWDCGQLLMLGHTESGVYTIYPGRVGEGVRVWCDMETDGGGWTVFLKRHRQDAQLNFSQSWDQYAAGFGNPQEEYWLGNRHVNAMTKGRGYTLRIDAENLEGEKRFGKWRSFSIGDESTKFKIRIQGYFAASSLGDVLTDSDQNGEKYNPNGMKFSTLDQDNDRREDKSCSHIFGYGGWWYNNCYRLNPTAPLGTSDGDNTKARLYYWGPDMSTVHGIKALQLKIKLS